MTFTTHVVRASFHSYPDENEKPVITSTISTHKKTLVKDKSFDLDSKFELRTAFPGVPSNSGIKISQELPIHTSKLSNGLTVATQDLPGLMSSIAFVVNAGRLVGFTCYPTKFVLRKF